MTTEQTVSTEQTVLTERRGGVMLITLNRPTRLNALTDDMREELRGALREARVDSSVRAVVVTGAGRAFCSGAEMVARPLAEPGAPPAPRPIPRTARYAWLQDFHHVPVPVIGAINGVAAGAGLGLALACDLRVMAPDAYFYPAFVHRGLASDNGVSWTLTRLAGPSRALRWLWSGDRIPAEQAWQVGLADAVAAEGEGATLAEALVLADKLANGPTIALGIMKQQVYHAIEASFADQLVFEELTTARNSGTEDSREGVAAFRERREPRFQGR
jgi:2-(1,2-epoxy-1,2-dihydrophenyl)acetyl-CoA isomerase